MLNIYCPSTEIVVSAEAKLVILKKITRLVKIFLNKLGPEPIKEITHHTGEWTLLFIIFTLAMSPLKKITNMNIWISIRRMLGLFVFFYASLHMLTYVGPNIG